MKSYKLSINETVPFNNNADFCIGTGRMGLALQYEYHKQLKRVQKDIGFKHIRGHGLFCDDMAIYQTYTENGVEKVEYNFQYVDRVFDDYLSLGIKPFVELGFMPGKLASGEQTIFYWKGNVTPPADYGKWSKLVAATVEHWINRYGRDEVITWPFEVWNEPNLPGFWKAADMEEYFKLYDVTVSAVKRCDERIRVGGPAICGVDDERWMRCFLEHCRDNKVPLDFITRHAYGTELPEMDGRYAYQKLRAPEGFLSEPEGSREIIDSFPEYKGMEMHITEFNTSYSPQNPIHDTNLNAAYIAKLLSVLGDTCASYSYWTFGDVFEESGVAFTPFSGCFGLLANGGIPKPTYWTFVFFKQLFPMAVARDEHFVISRSTGTVPHLRGIAWNPVFEGGGSGDLPLGNGDLPLSLSFEGLGDGEYLLLTKTVDENVCNPLKNWLDMGSPANPSARQLELLIECAKPQVATKQLSVAGGAAGFELNLSPNAVCFFELERVVPETDRGFRRERISGV